LRPIAMAIRSTTRDIAHRILGQPEIACRIAANPPFVIERHRAMLDVAAIPPLPAPVLIVHTGGKRFWYREGAAGAERSSLPGLVTMVPAGIRAEMVLRGIGEGMLVYFDDDRRTPRWLATSRARSPVTFVDNVIVTLAQQMTLAASAPRRDEAYLGTLGSALLAQLRHVLENPGERTALRGSRSGLLLAHVAAQHILGHLADPLTVRAVARQAGVGVTHFSLTFRQVTGMTPHRYIRRARIERACELLRMTSLAVGEVAGAVGFAGQSHFCTAFGREMGLTPSAYRRKCRNT
ncbi:MAG: AraC family transcriptional regulator, partial [Steroidobacteraceae bacterium]